MKSGTKSISCRTAKRASLGLGTPASAKITGCEPALRSTGEPLSSGTCAHRLWHRPLSGSHLHCQHGARLDSLARVLDYLLRRSLYRRWRKLRHGMPAAVGGFRHGTDVRALARNNSSTACSQLLAHARRTSRPGQVFGRVHCRSALGRLLGALAPFAR